LVVGGDFNIRLGFHLAGDHARHDFEADHLLHVTHRLNLRRLHAVNSEGSSYTNFPPRGGCATPDHIFTATSNVWRSPAAKILNTPTLISGAAHERMALTLRIRPPSSTAIKASPNPKKPPDDHPSWALFQDRVDQAALTWLSDVSPTLPPSLTGAQTDLSLTYSDLLASIEGALISTMPPRKVYVPRKAIRPPALLARDRVWKRLVVDSGNLDLWDKFEALIRIDTEEGRNHMVAITSTIKGIIGQSAAKQGSRFWSVVAAVKTPDKSKPPSRLWLDDPSAGGLRLVEDQEGLQKAWSSAFKRHPPLLDHKWMMRVKMETDNWFADRGESGWGDHDLEWDEFLKAWSASKVGGAPGPDGVLMRVLVNAGGQVKRIIFHILRACWRSEEVPKAFLEDLVKVIHKRNSPFLASNFRPVSLQSVVAKLLQRILVTRTRAWIDQTHDTERRGWSPTQFGALPGRDRLVMVLGVKATAQSLLFRQLPGEHTPIFVSTMDVESAFPRLWRQGLNWKLHQRGLTGKLWRMAQVLEEGSHGRISAGDFMSRMSVHLNGVNQGAITASDRFLLMIDDLPDDMVLDAPGPLMDAFEAGIYGYVDDQTQVNEILEHLQLRIDAALEHGQTWGYSWSDKDAKVNFIAMGAPASGNYRIKVDTLHADQDELELVGELIHRIPWRCVSQVERTCSRMGAAVSTLGWLGVFEGMPDFTASKTLLDSLVVSLLEAGLTLSTMSPAQYLKVDRVLARAGRLLLGIPTLASPEAVLAELRWPCAEAIHMKAVLLLFDRAQREAAGPLIRHIVTQRFKDVAEGDADGMFPLFHRFLETLSLQKYWVVTPDEALSRDMWKSRVKERIAVWQKSRWSFWVDVHGPRNSNLQAVIPTWGRPPARLYSQGTRLQVSLLAAFRLGCALLRSNKSAKPGVPRSCRFGCGHDEDEWHILLDDRCEALVPFRSKPLSLIDAALGGPAWRTDSSPESRLQAKATLLDGAGVPQALFQNLVLPEVKTLLGHIETLSTSADHGTLLEDPWAKGGSRDEEWQEGWSRLEQLDKWLHKF
jgi:hypothetical protein